MSVLRKKLFRKLLPKRVYFRFERHRLIDDADLIGLAGIMIK